MTISSKLPTNLSAYNMWKGYLNICYITKCLLFFITNCLISANQSGFKPGYSRINQLLSITHGIYASFDEGYEV